MKLSVMQWNICYAEDPEKVLRVIKLFNPDIVCLQELTKGYNPRYTDVGGYLKRGLAFNGQAEYGPMVLPDGSSALVGNAILTRWPVREVKKTILQTGTMENGRVVRDERMLLEVEIKLPKASVRVGTTHLPFHPRFRTSANKKAMIELISKRIGESDGRYILAADLNSTPRSKGGKSLRGQLKNAGPALRHKTWTTKPFRIGDWEYEGLRWRLDYILSKNMRVVGSRVIETEVSDHWPILGEFELNS